MALAVMFAALFGGAAFAAGSNDLKASSTHAAKDNAYWTRVWYKNNGYSLRNGKWVRTGKAVKRSKTRRSASKRSRSRSGRVVARVNLSTQRMTVSRNGRVLHSWKVSSGRKGYRTPTGTWTVHRMHKRYFSKKYHGAPMPYAMFYYRGFAIHGTNAISRLGRPASHGCVRLHPSNAAKLFAMVRRHGGTVKVTY